MTFVGKILVIVIVVFSLVFMGFAITVYSAHTNWKTVADKRQGDVTRLGSEVGGLRNQVTSLDQQLATEQEKIAQEVATLEMEDQQKRQELDDLRDQVNARIQEANENSRRAETALDEAEDRRLEAERLREDIAGLMTEKDGLFRNNVDLQTDLFERTSERDRAEKRNQQLQVRAAQLESLVRRIGGDPNQAESEEIIATLPLVEGLVLKTAGEEAGDRFVEISIGSDDGLRQGHQLLVWRPGPSPKYLGKIQIIDADPDRAVARVLSNFRIQKDDNVTSQFK